MRNSIKVSCVLPNIFDVSRYLLDNPRTFDKLLLLVYIHVVKYWRVTCLILQSQALVCTLVSHFFWHLRHKRPLICAMLTSCQDMTTTLLKAMLPPPTHLHTMYVLHLIGRCQFVILHKTQAKKGTEKTKSMSCSTLHFSKHQTSTNKFWKVHVHTFYCKHERLKCVYYYLYYYVLKHWIS